MTFQDTTLTNHDWAGAVRDGSQMASEQVKRGVEVQPYHVMWALLRQAAQVSNLTHRAPPRQGFPSKSAMPDTPDDVSEWAKMMSYYMGAIEERPETKSRPPQPSSAEITRCDVILHLWHHHALPRRPRIKKALMFTAMGMKSALVKRHTGYTRQQVHAHKKQAMEEMWEAMRVY